MQADEGVWTLLSQTGQTLQLTALVSHAPAALPSAGQQIQQTQRKGPKLEQRTFLGSRGTCQSPNLMSSRSNLSHSSLFSLLNSSLLGRLALCFFTALGWLFFSQTLTKRRTHPDLTRVTHRFISDSKIHQHVLEDVRKVSKVLAPHRKAWVQLWRTALLQRRTPKVSRVLLYRHRPPLQKTEV